MLRNKKRSNVYKKYNDATMCVRKAVLCSVAYLGGEAVVRSRPLWRGLWRRGHCAMAGVKNEKMSKKGRQTFSLGICWRLVCILIKVIKVVKCFGRPPVSKFLNTPLVILC
jgi:hypothetical protein